MESLEQTEGGYHTRRAYIRPKASEPPTSMKYEDKLIRLCQARGWDQADLMRAVRASSPDVKASRQTVSNWFSGKTKPDITTGLWVARALGVSLDYLADDAADEVPARPELTDAQERILWLVGQMGEAEALGRLVAIPGQFAGVTRARPESPSGGGAGGVGGEGGR